MKLRELQAFRAILQSGTVTGAAAQMRLTQPQVSRLIASLEAECGFPLFVRQNQRLIATPEARALYIEAERLLRGFEEVRDALERIRERQFDHVRIVTSQPLAEGLVAPALRLLANRNSRATCSIEIRSKMEIEARMAQHHFDLGISSLPIQADVVTETFASRDAVVVLPESHPRAGEPMIELTTLVDDPLIITRKGTYLRDHLERVFASANLVLNIRVETALSGFACRLVTQGIGVTFTDPFVAAAHAHEHVVLKRAEPALTVDYAFVLPRWQPTAPVTRSFMDCVAEVAEGVGWPP